VVLFFGGNDTGDKHRARCLLFSKSDNYYCTGCYYHHPADYRGSRAGNDYSGTNYGRTIQQTGNDYSGAGFNSGPLHCGQHPAGRHSQMGRTERPGNPDWSGMGRL
jgi:hypothetical protein